MGRVDESDNKINAAACVLLQFHAEQMGKNRVIVKALAPILKKGKGNGTTVWQPEEGGQERASGPLPDSTLPIARLASVPR